MEPESLCRAFWLFIFLMRETLFVALTAEKAEFISAYNNRESQPLLLEGL